MTALGAMMDRRWQADPRLLGITLARYKFVAKMLTGKSRVLEIGCGDGFGTRVVRQEVPEVIGIETDREMLADAHERGQGDGLHWGHWPCDLGQFDAAYCLDVIEHVPVEREDSFVGAMVRCAPVGIIGTPSAESAQYGSPSSRAQHINLKTEDQLRALMEKYYAHVFLFGMNDEVVHTGFGPMCHYRFAIGVRG